MILTMTKCHENLFRSSSLSLLSMIKSISSLKIKRFLKIPNKTFLRITRYLQNLPREYFDFTFHGEILFILRNQDDSKILTETFLAINRYFIYFFILFEVMSKQKVTMFVKLSNLPPCMNVVPKCENVSDFYERHRL